MTFKYSICYPDKSNIEFRDSPISASEVLDIAKNYPWREQLELSDSLNENEICYSPSLDFKCLETNRSFCLTADHNMKKDLQFSLWYNRPKKVKVFFGLLGEKEKMIVDDIWSYSLEDSLNYLELFTAGSYNSVERLFNK